MDINLKTKFWLLGSKNIQNSLLLGHLQQNLDLQCAIIDVNVTPDTSHIKSSEIVGIDALGLPYERCSKILEQLPHKNKTIITNFTQRRQNMLVLLLVLTELGYIHLYKRIR